MNLDLGQISIAKDPRAGCPDQSRVSAGQRSSRSVGVIPFEFYLDGPPLSQNTRNKRRLNAWKKRVRREASARWPAGEAPVTTEVSVKITYFYNSESPDVDNMIKPIQDALKGIVYEDDSQVGDTSSRKSRIDGVFKISGVSPELAVRLARGRDFVRVRVLSAATHEDLQ